eukprot:m51a1_g10923 hypothetical protein (174) ;mRNA; r:108126-108779
MRDRQGVPRGDCSQCSCKDYQLPATGNACDYCGHYPVQHREKSASAAYATAASSPGPVRVSTSPAAQSPPPMAAPAAPAASAPSPAPVSSRSYTPPAGARGGGMTLGSGLPLAAPVGVIPAPAQCPPKPAPPSAPARAAAPMPAVAVHAQTSKPKAVKSPEEWLHDKLKKKKC